MWGSRCHAGRRVGDNGRVTTRTAGSRAARLDQVCADAVGVARGGIEVIDPADVVERIEALAEGERTGEFEGGRYRYRLQVREVEDPVPVPEAPPGAPLAPELVAGPKLFRIALQVDWGEGGPRHRLDYVTLRARTPPLVGTSP